MYHTFRKIVILVLGVSYSALAQIPSKPLHYRPFQKTGFQCVSIKRKFNRALYGGNTAFRVEAGDFPEFALYLPGMGGNLKLGLIHKQQSKWLSEAKQIRTVYQDGKMTYQIQDELLGGATLFLNVAAAYTHEALILDYHCEGKLPEEVQLVVSYGGVTGKKFSRDGDIGADPESSFYLKPENCTNNRFQLKVNQFSLSYHPKDSTQLVTGIFSTTHSLKLSDARMQQTPLTALNATNDKVLSPCLLTIAPLEKETQYLWIQRGESALSYSDLPNIFKENERLRKQIASTIEINTPDSLLNPLGQALSLAADAIWDSPTYMHGAVAWRMRLPAWRGPYIADVLGQHDRAKTHFSAYGKSQVGSNFPLTNAVPDSAMHGARELEKIGSGIFTEGYICRNPNGEIKPHHYDMNLVYIDQLLNHFNWTGDTAYVREMWTVLEKHLAWEKHNFDPDNDGLFDAYCCIWASDALQYSGGAVTHSTAYNYKAFRTAAYLAKLLGKDDKPYQQEADKIYAALQKQLWLPETGSFAEYKDALGLKLTHPSAGLWTVYHAIDSEAASEAQQYSMTQYVDKQIPKIPFRIPELKEDFYLFSTTNWQPYTWSINNVTLGENLHTALACWQAGNRTMAYQLWRNTLVESLYTSASPGGFEQLASFDAVRGELYRDFADGIGMAGRSLVEGLFGIQPKLLSHQIKIKTGFPETWNYANFKSKDIKFDFKRNKQTYHYRIETYWQHANQLLVQIPSKYKNAKEVVVNGKPVKYTIEKTFSGESLLTFRTKEATIFDIQVVFGTSLNTPLSNENKGGENLVVKNDVNIPLSNKFTSIDLSTVFNDKVTRIFKNQYLSPRPTAPTLQLPYQGIGNWCYPLTNAVIDDRGVRKQAEEGKGIIHYQQIPYATPADTNKNNIAFVSKWDNFSDTLTIKPVQQQGRRLHIMLAGTTNPMQSRMENGKLLVTFEDGTNKTLSLQNPDTWWPIEQDYFYDGKAFYYDRQKRPTRLLLKSGKFTREETTYSTIKGYSNRAIEGGAANVYALDIPNKPIKSIQLIALCNDVIIGLMALTIEE
ncbi:MAG: DUF4450 domain-containing protein [Spirosomataceae bacterium]